MFDASQPCPQSITARKLPRGARLTLTCTGRGCPKRARMSVTARRVRRLLERLGGTRYRSGDRLLLVVSAPHRRSERIRLTIRTGKQPTARLLSRARHKR